MFMKYYREFLLFSAEYEPLHFGCRLSKLHFPNKSTVYVYALTHAYPVLFLANLITCSAINILYWLGIKENIRKTPCLIDWGLLIKYNSFENEIKVAVVGWVLYTRI